MALHAITTQPEEAWLGLLWLASQKPNARTYEVIGCGPLQDFLWTNSDYEARFIDAAHTDRSFHDFVKWCGLDDEDVGAQRIEDFDAKLKASPFARSHGA